MSTEDHGDSRSSADVFIEKAPNYRTIHVDGFIVTPTPKHDVVISMYSERLTIPRKMEVVDEGDGNFAERIAEDRNGMFRQVEASAFVDLNEIDELISELKRAKNFIENGMAHPESGESS